MHELTKSQIDLALLEWFRYDARINQEDFRDRMERAIGAALGSAPPPQFTQEQLDALVLASGYLRGAGLSETARVLWDMRRGVTAIDAAGAAAQSSDGEHVFPAELTPPVRRILGMMLWESGPIAGALRAAGKQINNRAEDEQATALHWLLGFALEHGMDWENAAAAALLKLTQAKKD